MNASPDQPDSVFNRPAEIGLRLAYLLGMAGAVAGPMTVLAGVASGHRATILAGLLILGLTVACHGWLGWRHRLRRTTCEFEAMFSMVSPLRRTRIAALVALLQEWETIETARGTPGFDPWALQSVRHHIHATIAQDPGLDRIFHE